MVRSLGKIQSLAIISRGYIGAIAMSVPRRTEALPFDEEDHLRGRELKRIVRVIFPASLTPVRNQKRTRERRAGPSARTLAAERASNYLAFISQSRSVREAACVGGRLRGPRTSVCADGNIVRLVEYVFGRDAQYAVGETLMLISVILNTSFLRKPWCRPACRESDR